MSEPMEEPDYTEAELRERITAVYVAATGLVGTADDEVLAVPTELAVDALLCTAAMIYDGARVQTPRTPKDRRDMTAECAERLRLFFNRMGVERRVSGQSMLTVMMHGFAGEEGAAGMQ